VGDHPGVKDDRTTEDVHVLACAECPRVSTAHARGWRATRIDDPELGEPPQLAFYCPECAQREFGPSA
jgi:hypothetical protein